MFIYSAWLLLRVSSSGPFLFSKQSPSSLSTDWAPLPSGVSCIRDATPEEMSPGKTCPRKTSEEGNRRGTESTEVSESSCGSQRKRADFSVLHALNDLLPNIKLHHLSILLLLLNHSLTFLLLPPFFTPLFLPSFLLSCCTIPLIPSLHSSFIPLL